MKKEEILKASRDENRNRDLPEMEVLTQAGTRGGRVGALMCCVVSLLSAMISHTMLYSPWIIYFSILGTQWFVRYIKAKRNSDLILAILFLCLTLLTFIGFVLRLLEVKTI